LILNGIKHLLNNARNFNEFTNFLKKTQCFSSENALKFLFFQFNYGNAQYFLQQNDMQHVYISDTPHYNVAKQSISNDSKKIVNAKNQYIEYLKSSWPSYDLDIHQEKLDSKYKNYLEYIDKVSIEGKLNTPVLLTKIPGKQGYYVVDGNHRCSIACALGISVPVKVLDFPSVFDQFMKVEEFYGTKNKNMPYQSIYIDKKIIRKGRRDDIYERLGLLPENILKQKTVLDVGCNIGMNAIASFKLGARKVVGLEISKKMVDFATRFAIFDECYPDVSFRQFNVDRDHLPKDEKYDIAFMLSIHHHLKNPHALAEIARKSVEKIVVFEGHPNTKLSDYKDFLDLVKFSKIDKIGDLSLSVFDRKPNRPLWILYK